MTFEIILSNGLHRFTTSYGGPGSFHRIIAPDSNTVSIQ